MARYSVFMMLLVFLLAPVGFGQEKKPAPFTPPDDLAFRKATIVSEGTRMAAEVYSLKSQGGKKLPTIIMCHGWGGVAANLRADAVLFAKAGYLVVLFDYRGWGESEARVVLTKPMPEERGKGRFTAEVTEVREIVDPFEMTTDLMNAVHWVHGEPMCDTSRIGLWGSSYSGGHVVFVAAARDKRIKATVSQVPALDSRFVIQTPKDKKQTFDEATKHARGELGYPEPGVKAVGNLKGAPIREKLMYYVPAADAGKAAPDCAMLFVIAEKEELFDNKDHGIRAYGLAQGPKKLVTIPKITHYGIYREVLRPQAQQLALEWFDTYLKAERKPADRK